MDDIKYDVNDYIDNDGNNTNNNNKIKILHPHNYTSYQNSNPKNILKFTESIRKLQRPYKFTSSGSKPHQKLKKPHNSSYNTK
jgi:hypothetical protein